MARALVFYFFVTVFVISGSSLFSLEFVYLTFSGDPSRFMAIHWLEERMGTKTQNIIYKSLKNEDWMQSKASFTKLNGYVLNRIILSDLEPDTDYVFCLGGENAQYRFRTLPSSLSRPFRIALGGDAYKNLASYQKMNAQVAKMSPDFVILGGDLAYANKGKAMLRWKTFFQEWQKSMIAEDGRMIPLVAAVGNHDVLSKSSKKMKKELFLEFFPYLEKGSYGTVDIAGNLSFFLLDTDHINSIKGDQSSWLKNALSTNSSEYKFAVYHVGAYPSIYSYKGEIPSLIRSSWSPLFETYGIVAAFENHNHAFKRTYPIKQEKVDPQGVVYIGDGCWSVSPRKSWGKRWYLESKKSVSSFSLLTVSYEGIDVQSIDDKGQVFDKWTPRR